MIVDDNPLLRRTAREILSVEFPDSKISEAADGNQMRAAFEEDPPDLVFMDIKLREENGLELTREIKARHPHVVVVIFTNYDFPEYRQKADLSGAEFFLSKLDSKATDLTRVAYDVLSR